MSSIEELEQVGLLAKADPDECFQQVKAGVWRVEFRKATASQSPPTSGAPGPRDLEQAPSLLDTLG